MKGPVVLLELIRRARDELLIAQHARSLLDRQERIAAADERLEVAEEILTNTLPDA